MAWTEGDARVDGVRIHYYRRGSGPPVVLVHGGTDNGLCWNRVAQQLEADFEVIAYDVRCHGRSDAPASGIQSSPVDLTGLIAALDLGPTAVIGHSMGAGIALEAVSDHPENFCGAILEDPGWGVVEMVMADRDAVRTMLSSMAVGSAEEILERGQATSPSWHDDEWDAWVRAKVEFAPNVAFAFEHGLPGFADWRGLVSRLATPTLLLCGGPSALVTPAVAAEAQALSPLLEMESFPDAGHNVRREAFEGFMASVRAFLSLHAAVPAP